MADTLLKIIVVDDDEDDCLLIQEALAEAKLANPVVFKHDGQALLDYLKLADRLPGLILLDLNMPGMDGRTVLKELKQDTEWCKVPVVILTTSRSEADVQQTYSLGASGFISKPVRFDDFVSIMKTLDNYWFHMVDLPS